MKTDFGIGLSVYAACIAEFGVAIPLIGNCIGFLLISGAEVPTDSAADETEGLPPVNVLGVIAATEFRFWTYGIESLNCCMLC